MSELREKIAAKIAPHMRLISFNPDCETQEQNKQYALEVADTVLALIQKEQVWRDMSEAPKDGTRVLLFVPPYGPSTGHYVNGSRWDVGGKRLLPARWAVHSCLNDEAQPTHWMPLPLPPTPPQGEDG